MSTYRLEQLFSPRSVAVVGASQRQDSLGRKVVSNLKTGGFKGDIFPISITDNVVEGLPAKRTLVELEKPDLAVIAVPPPVVPSIVLEAGRLGIAAAVIMTAGLGHGPGSASEACLQNARANGLRLLGPNCLGVVAPLAKLNASFAAHAAPAGDLALVSQSGAIAAGMIEWASRRGVGFSAIASLGDQLDVDFGDLLDFFALDHQTRAILLYIESIQDARKFMSAARAAARTKPVVVIKAGRHAQAAKAATTHTGALAGSDAVYEAAFRRAGLLRVVDLGELFDAAETLGRLSKLGGNRLAILTNGGGIGVLAIDRLIDFGGAPAELSPETIARLDAVLPATWSKSNPVDIVGDADASRYAASLQILLEAPEVDAILAMNVETALASSVDIANSVVDVLKAEPTKSLRPKPVLSVWVGNEEEIADTFTSANIPHYATETDAVRGFMHLVRHRDAIRALMETPPSLPEQFSPDVTVAHRIVKNALADERKWLNPFEVVELFNAYAIPIVPAVLASDPEKAEALSAQFLAAGGTVAVKIVSRDIVHKSDVGGVRLNLASASAVRQAAEEVTGNAKAARPEARIEGVMLQPMIVRPGARELIAGIADDPTFGPIIAFGHGGTAVEVINDKALALPPLDLRLARDLIEQTRVFRLLQAHRDLSAANLDDVALVLVKLAQLVADVPEVKELDINPLLADERGVLSLDARVAVAPAPAKLKGRGHPRLAIRPYPSEWQRRWELANDWRIVVRPVRPEDEALVHAFFEKVSPEDLRLRFFAPVKDIGHAFIARLTQLDYARAIAFVAIDDQSKEMIGGVRLHADANYEAGEFAILLRSDLKGRGLGWKLMELIVEYARAEGLKRITGQILRENAVMLRMCREIGFEIKDDPRDRSLCLATLIL